MNLNTDRGPLSLFCYLTDRSLYEAVFVLVDPNGYKTTHMKILVVDDERDMKLGADDFLTKPLEFGILKEKIKAIL